MAFVDIHLIGEFEDPDRVVKPGATD